MIRAVAVIPAYNEEKTISDIVKRTKKYVDKVMVVDNCSTDNTSKECALIRDVGIYDCKIKGAGAATRMAWKNVAWDGYDAMITLDADGQHNPDDIPMLLTGLNEADIVIGARFLDGYSVPPYRKFGIDIITWLYNIGHKPITDAQSCFRAYNRNVLDFIDIAENGFGFSTEVLIKARKQGFKITEVPIDCIYHSDFKQNSTLNPVHHGLEVAFKTLKWRLKLRD